MNALNLTLAIALTCTASAVSAARAKAKDPRPDYRQAANWVCRPGSEAICTNGLDVLTITGKNRPIREMFKPASNPAIDCFYVYPTVSEERSPYSDLRLTPGIADAARGQAGRLTSRCRLFVPIYRQLTEAGLSAVLAAHESPDWRMPYGDILAAWRWYRAHDNHGRGVVLIGHSQGSILLRKLLAQEIDGKVDQHILVAGFLGGDVSQSAADGSVGAFKHIPWCAVGEQIGCAYTWNSYLADDHAGHRVFGNNPPAPLVAGCDTPAAPGGGASALKAYFERPESAPAGDPPWVDWVGALSGQCAADAQGNVFRVTIRPGPFSAAVRGALRRGSDGDPQGWGLHGLDMDLMQGSVLDRVSEEIATWSGARGGAPGRPPRRRHRSSSD